MMAPRHDRSPDPCSGQGYGLSEGHFSRVTRALLAPGLRDGCAREERIAGETGSVRGHATGPADRLCPRSASSAASV
jgi:hypothetical protein